MTKTPLAAAAAAMLLLPACGGGGGRTAAVTVRLLAFEPAPLRVPRGTTVTWTDAEPITHTITSGTVSGVDPATGLRSGQRADGRFDGRLAGRGSSFSYRFADAGEFSYFCSIHYGMNATVVTS